MRQLSYWVSSIIWLSLEDWYNAGLTPERAREIIEGIQDPGMMAFLGSRLRCETQGVNGNWNVRIATTDPRTIVKTVSLIRDRLDAELASRRESSKPKVGQDVDESLQKS